MNESSAGRWAAELAFALELADIADEVSMRHFRSAGLVVETKPDLSPVTIADRAVEQAIRARIASGRPDHGVLGEEYGDDAVGGRTGPRWIIDPIDGTKKYVRRMPNWGTLLALEVDGQPVVGVASAPAVGRRWWGALGKGAYADGRRLQVSQVATLAEAHVLHGSTESWTRKDRWDQLGTIARRCWHMSGFADFSAHLLVAEGFADAGVEASGAVWDLAALKIIVEEAGGRFTDLDGANSAASGHGVSTNGRIHDEILAVTRG
jgi:histidinol-phosphatase